MTTTEELAEKLRTGRVLTTDEGSPLQEAAARLLEQGAHPVVTDWRMLSDAI